MGRPLGNHNFWSDDFLKPLNEIAQRLSGTSFTVEEIISIAYWRIIRYGKHTPENFYYQLRLHLFMELKNRTAKKLHEREVLCLAERTDFHEITNCTEQSCTEVHCQQDLYIEEILSSLSKLDRYLVKKHVIDNYSYNELGEALDRSSEWVRKRVIGAMEKIRKDFFDGHKEFGESV